MSFKQFWICDKCDSRFIESPENECPVCIEIIEVTKLIDTMKTQKEYIDIKIRINKMEDSIPKFDLFNKINRMKKLKKDIE